MGLEINQKKAYHDMENRHICIKIDEDNILRFEEVDHFTCIGLLSLGTQETKKKTDKNNSDKQMYPLTKRTNKKQNIVKKRKTEIYKTILRPI
ncbi:hypothetical protein ILUMI_14340, partial [Ignelater luminosus]